jgi:hypothetical protein
MGIVHDESMRQTSEAARVARSLFVPHVAKNVTRKKFALSLKHAKKVHQISVFMHWVIRDTQYTCALARLHTHARTHAHILTYMHTHTTHTNTHNSVVVKKWLKRGGEVTCSS